MDVSANQQIWFKKVLFSVQLFVLVAMLFTAIANIILKTGNLSLWTALLGSSFGFLLPTPKYPRSLKPETVIQAVTNPIPI